MQNADDAESIVGIEHDCCTSFVLVEPECRMQGRHAETFSSDAAHDPCSSALVLCGACAVTFLYVFSFSANIQIHAVAGMHFAHTAA